MSIKAILFDLDGTLLPMNQDEFIGNYMRDLTAYMCKGGLHNPEEYFNVVWQGVYAMIKNNNVKTNEAVYFDKIGEAYGDACAKEEYGKYLEFYKTKYLEGKVFTWYTSKSRELIDSLKSKGIRVALATNPVFPSVATEGRMSWVDLKPCDFELVTTCDNTGYSKPNPKYYLDIAEKMGVDPCECLMVGNDVEDDMPAATVGMDVFLLTDCLINKKDKDISAFPHGDFDRLIEYINKKCLP